MWNEDQQSLIMLCVCVFVGLKFEFELRPETS